MTTFVRESISKNLIKATYPIRRELPARGQLAVRPGDRVTATQVIGQCKMPGDSEYFRLSSMLGVSPRQIQKYLRKQIGEHLRVNEEVAARTFFGRKRSFRSPIDGTLTEIDDKTGQVIIQRNSIDFSLEAGFEGEISRVEDSRMIDINVVATILQGMMGIGLPVMGTIETVTEAGESLLSRHIDGGCCDHILISSGPIDYELLKRAMAMGVRGIIAGSIPARDFQDYIAKECDGDVDGPKSKAIGLILTEGFGKIRMRQQFWEFLSGLRGELVLMNELTNGKPGLIYPSENYQVPLGGVHSSERSFIPLKSRQRVRLIAGLHFGQEGVIANERIVASEDPEEPGPDMIKVQLDGGAAVLVPRWNLEAIHL